MDRPFGSREFDSHASKLNIKLKFLNPRYPQSNGLVEKGLAIAKNKLKRCYEAIEVALYQYRTLEYNTTPVAGMQLSPPTLFFGRLIKIKLPVSGSLLTTNNLTEDFVQEKIERKKNKQKYYCDRNDIVKMSRSCITVKTFHYLDAL